MINYNYLLIKSIITAIGVIVCIITFSYWLYKLKKNKKIASKDFYLSIFLLFLSIWVNTFDEEFLYRFNREQLYITDNLWIDAGVITGIIHVIQVLTPLIAILFILIKSFKNVNNSQTESQVEDFVQKVFANEKFHTAFLTNLPKGKNDDEYGLDYIPFMLQSIENKRKRFKIYSERFLTATLTLGVFFIIIVIFFGYILLDDSSIGLAKNIVDLKKELSIANSNMATIQDGDAYDNLLNTYRVDFYTINKMSSKNGKNQKVINSIKKT
ncbi:hypothetical protein [Flavobacterium phycosphaerae]|uniref:hypothetical protein n=1 Tax=Flavobacterium phycosphaerae TaxID=2697515 RepID=UPI0013899309|nr:hypothetical protein [Flavobacterium phycosphaerae]